MLFLVGVFVLCIAAIVWATTGKRRRPTGPDDLRRVGEDQGPDPRAAAENAADRSSWMLGGGGM